MVASARSVKGWTAREVNDLRHGPSAWSAQVPEAPAWRAGRLLGEARNERGLAIEAPAGLGRRTAP